MTSIEEQMIKQGLTAPRVTSGHIDALVARLTFAAHIFPGTTSTVAIAQLDGFVVGIGHSACVSPANFNAEIGAKIAIENATDRAREKLWELEGYLLKRDLAKLAEDFPDSESNPVAAPVPEVQLTDAPTLTAAPAADAAVPVDTATAAAPEAAADPVADVEHQPV